MKHTGSKHQQGHAVSDQAKVELNQLMEELFVGKLRADMEALYQQSGNIKTELTEKLDIQSGRLAWLQSQLKQLAEELPDQLKPLGVIVEVKETLDELLEGLAGRLDSMEDELTEKLQHAASEATGEVSELNAKLIQTVVDHHTEMLRNASGVINESFSQVAAAISTTAEHLNSESARSQSELQALLDRVRNDQTARVEAVEKELQQQIKNGQDAMLAALADAESKRKRQSWFGLGLLVLQAALLAAIGVKVFG